MQTVYFVDFDNTVSCVDVWDNIVTRFAQGDGESIVREYDSGQISSREFNRRLVGMLRADEHEVRSFIMSMEIDPSFQRFVELVREHDREILLVSDGYDLYIQPLLDREGLGYLPYFSNHMEWENGRARASFPHYRDDCETDMANCKCQYLRLGETALRRVYIGDGISDICAARRADVVYAKSDLQRHFEKEGNSFTPFKTFDDIISLEFGSCYDSINYYMK